MSIGAGVLHYPWGRFIAYDAVAAVIWALQAALPGYIGGVVFADRPWIGLAIGIVLAVVVTVTIEGIRRSARGDGPQGPSIPGRAAATGAPLVRGPRYQARPSTAAIASHAPTEDHRRL